MSKQGIKIFANVLSVMQEERQRLIKLGCSEDAGFGKSIPLSESSKQDILLGQLLEKAKDAVKNDFCKITMGKI
jgi:hypothetical protein